MERSGRDISTGGTVLVARAYHVVEENLFVENPTSTTENRSPQFTMQIFHGRSIPDLYDLYDPANVAGCDPCSLHDLSRARVFPVFDLYYADPAQPRTTASEDL